MSPSAADAEHRRIAPDRVILLLPFLLLLGCASPRSSEPPATARFYLEAAAGERAVPLVLPQSEAQISVVAKPVLTEYDITNVEVAELELGPCLLFELTPAAARALYRLSGNHQGRRLVLLIDGQPMGARVLDAPIADGRLLVFIERPDRELSALSAHLKNSVGAW